MIANKLNQTEYLSLYNIMAANKQKETDSKWEAFVLPNWIVLEPNKNVLEEQFSDPVIYST